jgi:hypothetical protein
MSSPRETPPDPLAAFTEQWLEWWRQASSLGFGGLAAGAVFPDYRQLQKLWLADLTQTMDRYMRSSAFLELMRCNLKTMTQSTELVAPSRLR